MSCSAITHDEGGTQELENSHFQKCTYDTEYFMGFQNCFRHIPHKTLLIIQFRCKCLVFWHGPHQYAFTSWCHYSPRILTSYIASHIVHNLLSSTPLPKISISNHLLQWPSHISSFFYHIRNLKAPLCPVHVSLPSCYIRLTFTMSSTSLLHL